MSRIRTITMVSLVAAAMVIGATIPAWANGGIPPLYDCWCVCEERGPAMVYMCKEDIYTGKQQTICVDYHAVEPLALHGFRLGQCEVPYWESNRCGINPDYPEYSTQRCLDWGWWE